MRSENSQRRIQLIAGGDVMLGRQMPGYVSLHGADWPFQDLRPLLQTADLALVNLETVIGSGGDFIDKGGRQPYYYHALPDMLDVLTAAGINCLATANNHAMDYGPVALTQQCDVLDAAGFIHAGAGRNLDQAARPAFACVNGLSVAFIGVETETPVIAAKEKRPGVFHAPIAELAQALAAPIATARAQADVVIVTPHWGANWLEAPSEDIRSAARKLIELGADAILGHSAHILQGIELYNGKPIIYDMGTLLFDRVAQNRMADSALFELELDGNGVRNITIHPLKLSAGQARLACGEDAARVRELLVRLSRELDAATTFEAVGETLCLACSPSPRAVAPRETAAAAPQASLPDAWRQLRSNLVYDTMPVDGGWSSTVVVNPALEVLGARFASPVRPDRGFVCEVYFRASAPPMPSRIEARLIGRDVNGETAFSYTHPVAEGIHPPPRWNRNEVICDRVLVRPGKALAEGRYKLYWQLLDQEKRAAIQISGDHERLVNGRIFLGVLEIRQDAPKGVAGIAKPLRLKRADEARQYLAWKSDPLRFWTTQAKDWTQRALAQRGVVLMASSASVVRNNPWGLVVSLMTDKGRVYFKATSRTNRFEPRLLAALSARWPCCIPRPLAIHPAAGWMLTPNYGRTRLDTHGDAVSRDMTPDVLAALADIQIDASHQITELLALGVPDRRMQCLPAQLETLLADDETLAIGQPHGLTPLERDTALMLLPFFRDVCLTLAMMPGAESLDQGDLHMGNIIQRGESSLFLDWGDASVAHPFGVLLLAHHQMRQRKAGGLARLDALAAPYLARWQAPTGLDPKTLTDALHLALWVAHINRALNWANYAALNETTAAGHSRILAARWVRFWLEDTPRLTGRYLQRPHQHQTANPALATLDNPLLLDPETMSMVTDGEWQNWSTDIQLSGISHNRKYLLNHSQGNLYFPINAKASDLTFDEQNAAAINKAMQQGAVAAIAPRDAPGLPPGLPLLRVSGTVMAALEALGSHVRDHLFHGTRVIVTGTEGKTSFKCMLHHVLSPQIPTYAMLNSTNLDFSIYASFASIRQKDQIAIFEAAGTHPGRCKRRSQIVKPNMFVITEVGNEHIGFHGSQEAVIEGKADICLGLEENGYGLLNADSRNFNATREAVLRRKNVPLLLFGSGPECHGRLLSSRFEQTEACSGWHVSANIQGTVVDYCMPLLGEHAPLASVSVLLAAHALGADVTQAAAALASFVPYESSGVLRRIAIRGGEALLFDNSTRASVLSYQSYLRTAARLVPPQPGGRKIALIGQMIFLGDEAKREHAQLADWIAEAGFDDMIFVGKHMETAYDNLANPSPVVRRFPDYDRRTAKSAETRALTDALLALVRPGDLIFIKGEVDEVGEHLRSLEIKRS